MEITREAIEERMQNALNTKQIKLNELQQLEGVLMDCKFWLEQLEEQKKKVEKSDKEASSSKLDKVK